jgi:opacity protein-like surface antigen
MFKKILLMIALFSLFSAAKAVADVDAGVNIDWNHPRNANREDVGVGGRVDFGGQVRGQIAFDYIFQNADDIFGPGEVNSSDFNLRFWELNANLLYQFPTETVHPYLGAGLGFARRTFDDTLTDVFDNKRTEFGVNAIGGLKFGHGVEPFIEARYTWYPNKRDEVFGIDPLDLGARLRFHDRFILSGGILF